MGVGGDVYSPDVLNLTILLINSLCLINYMAAPYLQFVVPFFFFYVHDDPLSDAIHIHQSRQIDLQRLCDVEHFVIIAIFHIFNFVLESLLVNCHRIIPTGHFVEFSNKFFFRFHNLFNASTSWVFYVLLNSLTSWFWTVLWTHAFMCKS